MIATRFGRGLKAVWWTVLLPHSVAKFRLGLRLIYNHPEPKMPTLSLCIIILAALLADSVQRYISIQATTPKNRPIDPLTKLL